MYNDIVDEIQSLLISSGFVESSETITLDELPSAVSDKRFSVTLDSIEIASYETQDRFFPIEKIKVVAVYFVGNNSFNKYEIGTSWNEDLISLVMNPNNWHSSVRNISFAGSATAIKASEGNNYLMVENTFNAEVSMLYVPVFNDNVYTDTTVDETVDASTYTDTNNRTIDAGTY